jgi:hypothetical protein
MIAAAARKSKNEEAGGRSRKQEQRAGKTRRQPVSFSPAAFKRH